MTILPCRDPSLLARLVPLATAEGFQHLTRLVTEWSEGTNRFDQLGETLLIVREREVTIACGGLTRQTPTTGRMRRVYVDPEFRRRGIGRAIAETLIEQAKENFKELVLYTDNPSAARFYEQLGFTPEEPSEPDFATHRLLL